MSVLKWETIEGTYDTKYRKDNVESIYGETIEKELRAKIDNFGSGLEHDTIEQLTTKERESLTERFIQDNDKWNITPAIFRARVPGGWIVAFKEESSDGRMGGITFVPDPDHNWE